jgi:bifunctional DNA-binding transcriptional regulator/antitoxin component of YhaV-PrlF toxin-antitoxin module
MTMASSNGTTLRIDKAARIVLAKPLREPQGLRPGTELEAVDEQGGIPLRPVEERRRLMKIDGLWVYRGAAQAGGKWERLIEQVREERLGATGTC